MAKEPQGSGRSESKEGSGSPLPKTDDENASLWKLAGSGMELAAAVGALTALGWWLDKKWNTAPWLLVIGAGLGLVGGMYNLWKSAKRYM